MPPDREALVHAHLSLVPQIVASFCRSFTVRDRAVEHADLIAEGYLGLCRAALHWDAERGTFRRYARVVIHRRLLRLLDQARRAGHSSFRRVSLETSLAGEEALTLGEILPTSEPGPEELLLRKEFRHTVDLALAQFPLQIQLIVRDGLEERTLRESARRYGKEPADIASVQRRATRRLAQAVLE